MKKGGEEREMNGGKWGRNGVGRHEGKGSEEMVIKKEEEGEEGIEDGKKVERNRKK